MKFTEIAKYGLSRVDTIKLSTAMNPIVILAGFTLAARLFTAVSVSDQSFRFALLIAGMLVVLAAVGAYFILLFRDPDRLQSEEYQIRQSEMKILYRKGRRSDRAEFSKRIPLSGSSSGSPKNGDER